MIEIINIHKGFAVKFPFALKDQFKAKFKSAIWNASEKQWEVGQRAGGRLRQWVTLVNNSDVITEIETAHEQEMTEKEIKEIEGQLSVLKMEFNTASRNLDKQKERLARLTEVKQELAGAEHQLALIKADVRTATEEKESSEQEVKALLAGIVDMGKVLSAKQDMSQLIKQVGSRAHRGFDGAQKIIKEEYKRLKAAGFVCTAFEYLVDANFNRPDRDDPALIKDEDLLMVKKVEA